MFVCVREPMRINDYIGMLACKIKAIKVSLTIDLATQRERTTLHNSLGNVCIGMNLPFGI